MSRGDEVWTTAYNVLHAGLGRCGVRHKDCSVRPSHPIMRRLGADLEEKQELHGGKAFGRGRKEGEKAITDIRLTGHSPILPAGLLLLSFVRRT